MDIVTIYLIQMLVCAAINIAKGTRIPKSLTEFFLFTFLPWRLLHLNSKELN